MSKKKETRNIAFDILRIVALIMVFYNHRYTYTIADTFNTINIKYIIVSILSILCKCGVPLFLMISGSLLLNKKEDYKYILKHRVLRIIIVMIICALLKYTWYDDTLINIFLHEINWYLYYYLGYLMLLPLIKKLANRISEKKNKINIFFIITIFIYLIYVVLTYFISNNYKIVYSSMIFEIINFIIYPISGYLLTKLLDDKNNNKKIIIKLLILTIITLVITFILCTLDIKNTFGFNIELIRKYGIYTISLFIFSSVYLKSPKIKSRELKDFISVVALATFGAYIIETHTAYSDKIFHFLDSFFSIYIGKYFVAVLTIFFEVVIYSIIVILIRLTHIGKKIL